MAGRLTLDFLKTQSAAGLAPVVAAAIAIALANSPWSDRYLGLLAVPIPLQIGAFAHTLSLQSWVHDGLMAIFFLVVGMEIKFEFLRGELSSPRRLSLPVLAAVGGMIVPALIYLAINLGPGGASAGWPLATATDIALGLAALAMVAPGLPPPLRVFLLAVAIVDDLGSVGLIAVLYSTRIHVAGLAGAGLCLAALALLSNWRRAPLILYAVGFTMAWGFTLNSGINTSVAGVACALTAPVGARRPGQESVLKLFMDSLHPYVAFAVLPLFAFTSAGFSLGTLAAANGPTRLAVGLVLALVVGKPLGVFGFSLLGAALRLGRRPTGVTWLEMAGVASLCGAGFTMSLYLAALAFGHAPVVIQAQARLGVFAGSLIAVFLGAALLALARARREAAGDDQLDRALASRAR